jgi:hypothetical protein
LSPTPSNLSAIKTPENTAEDPNAPQPAAEGDIQKEYSSDWLYNPSIGTLPKNYLQELRSGHVPSDNKFDNLPPVQSHASWIHELKVCKSVHHHTIQINQPTRCNNFSSLLPDVYLQLNMFRASSCQSSGATTAVAAFGFTFRAW